MGSMTVNFVPLANRALAKKNMAEVKLYSLDWFEGKFTGNHGFYH
jgi:hypothetical protein